MSKKHLEAWRKAVKQAGGCLMPKKNTAEYRKVREIYDALIQKSSSSHKPKPKRRLYNPKGAAKL
jgi:hypothetical protein